ncbi:hypothetical protein ColTof3_09096 [Colletotrichum tofieldiae]|nr:hypothetical protein ColTof3_09096 [Colletotrichum tofieldiae]
MNKRIFLLALLTPFGDGVAVGPGEHANDLVSTFCFTFLSTYLEPVGPLPTSPALPSLPGTSAPTLTSGTSASSVPPSASRSSSSSPSIRSGPSLSGTSTALGTTSPSSTTTTLGATPSPSGPAVQPVIFFVFPIIGGAKRDIERRALGGFLNHDAGINRDSCSSASTFIFSSGQLLDAGNPIFFTPGDANKLLRNAGPPPSNAITTTFENVAGTLRFSNPSIPGGQANFCQDPSGQVFITFTSRPDNCQAVLLYTYRYLLDGSSEY